MDDYNLTARNELKADSEYELLKSIYSIMDKYCLDPILGFVAPGLGDTVLCALTIPFIYTAIFKLRSFPLTVSIIYNASVDALIGMIPVAGDIGDLFVRSYKKSYQQIVGYTEGDPETIRRIKGNTVKSCILIAIIGILIYFVIKLIGDVFTGIVGLFS